MRAGVRLPVGWLGLVALAFGAAQDDPSSFAKDERIVAAYYDPAPDSRPETDFLEMGKAGVDVALISFPDDPERLAPLVAALEAVEKNIKNPPRLGVFLSPGPGPSLSGVEKFYGRVPARHWARVGGRPLVWLGPPPPGGPRDPAALEEAVRRLSTPPYLVAEVSWKGVPADRTYASGRTRGYGLDLPVVSVTPGRTDREDGKVYQRTWTRALRLEPRMVAIESWNGAQDGVSETPDRRRKYLDLTHQFVRDYKTHEKPSLPKGKWTGATKVAYTIVYNPHEEGLRPMAVEDGLIEEILLRGFEALSSKENKKGSIRRISFDVDDSFCYFEKRTFEVAFEYLDVGEGSFSLEYDSADRDLPPEERVVKSAGVVRFTGSGGWRTASLVLPDALFGNGQPGGSDFRFSVDKRGLSLRSVLVMKR